LLAWLALNAGKHTGNQPTRLAHLDDGYDRAILVQGDEGPAQSLPRRRPGSFGWGIAGTPSIRCSDEVAIPRRPPHSVSRSRSDVILMLELSIMLASGRSRPAAPKSRLPGLTLLGRTSEHPSRNTKQRARVLPPVPGS